MRRERVPPPTPPHDRPAAARDCRDGMGQGRAGWAESRSRRFQPSQKLTCTRRMLSRAFQHLPVPPPELEGISAINWLHVWGVPGSDCFDILPFFVLPHCCQVFQACRHCMHSTAACQDMGSGEAVAWLWRGKDGLGFPGRVRHGSHPFKHTSPKPTSVGLSWKVGIRLFRRCHVAHQPEGGVNAWQHLCQRGQQRVPVGGWAGRRARSSSRG